MIRAVTEEHLVKHNSQRPDVGLVGIDLAFEDFWSHVDGRA